MLRNKELQTYLMVMSGIGVAATFGTWRLNRLAGVFVLIASGVFIGISLLFNHWRYQELQKLSGYLRCICNGEYSLDLRDNKEGELSILKNEIYKVTLMLSKQGEQMKKEKEQLSDVLADISHQLKTPLTSMMVMADLLSENNLHPEKRAEFTQNIQVQLERMQWLLAALLKLSKIDAGTAVFKKEEVNVSKLVNEAIKPLLVQMEIKEQNCIIKGDRYVSFIGDLKWTIEAVLNVVKNCVEHTPRGGKVSIYYSENPLYTEIKISDNGNGIVKEDLPYLFKRFYRGQNASEESVGIGLAMARSIVASQNGAISASNKKDGGAEFCIKFYKNIV